MPVTSAQGLTAAEVEQRRADGRTNDAGERTSRTVGEIVRANVFTRFNAILGAMLVIVLVSGDYRDGLFGIVLVANASIGIFQELRAKRTLDRLAVLSAPTARAVRDGRVAEVAIADVVLDDLLELRTGDQVPADGEVTESDGLELDESLLTGEADPVVKAPGDPVLSGSIVVAGRGRCVTTAVGRDAYARRLAIEARRFELVRSELMAGINLILKWVTVALVIVGPLLFWSQLRDASAHDALVSAVAGVVGMVPEGLVLLTSIAFGVASVTLARRQVLVQELPAVEVLARVDVVCLDKTGTLTEGVVDLDRVEALAGADEAEVRAALGALADDEGANATLAAVGTACPPPDGWTRTAGIAFSSARKWSAASFDGRGTWVLGAPEMVWPDAAHDVRTQADAIAGEGSRVLLLAHTDAQVAGESRPDGLVPAALVVLAERVRPDAAETLAYFAEQGVMLKVISGDNPRTVGAVARRVGLPHADTAMDARELPEDDPEALADAIDRHAVFGRVTPHQKRAMVGALQARGHVVAMTGDGVNDALALKDADLGVAMGSGAAATRAVAQLVLLDGRFARLPGVVAEGRRVAANVERVANLFITKTIYATLLALAVAIAGVTYPFLPRHLTIVSSLTIGIPAFFLALAPNARRYLPGFVPRVLRFAVPAGVIAAAAVFVAYSLARHADATVIEARTVSTLVLVLVGLWVLVILARPFTRGRVLLVGLLALAVPVGASLAFVRDFFELDLPSTAVIVESLVVAAIAIGVLEVVERLVTRWSTTS